MSDPVWCESCEGAVVSPVWPGHDQCAGCLRAHVKPYDYVPAHYTHYDLGVALAQVRAKVAQWEVAHPGWRLEPDQQRVWEDSTAPSKYVDRETSIGRKQVRSRFRVVRAHPRGRRMTLVQFEAAWPGVRQLRASQPTLIGLDTETGETTVVAAWGTEEA